MTYEIGSARPGGRMCVAGSEYGTSKQSDRSCGVQWHQSALRGEVGRCPALRTGRETSAPEVLK